MSDSDNHHSTTAATPGAGWTNGAIPVQQQQQQQNQQQLQLYPHTIPGKIDLFHAHRRWIGLGNTSSWSRIGEGCTELSARTGSSSSCTTPNSLTTTTTTTTTAAQSLEQEAQTVRALMAQLCQFFYQAGWATGTGGGISIRTGGPAEHRPWRVFVAPSGLQKEDLIGADMFELDMDRRVIQAPTSNPALHQSACTPLWYVIFNLRPTARAVVHTHSLNAVYATLLDPTEQAQSVKITHLEMLKGVGNHAYDDVLELPIIDNRPTEDLLADQLAAAVQQYPHANAVLVRRHGLYAWGDSWEQCKTITESVDYLLACAVQMKQVLGIDPAVIPPSGTYREETNEKMKVGSKKITKRVVVNDDNNDNDDQPVAVKKCKTADTVTATATTTTTTVVAATTGFNGVADTDNSADCWSNPTPILPRDKQYKALLLDIEGCTSSIAFVKNVLFPFVREHLPAFLEQHVMPEYTAITLLQALQQEVKEQQQKELATEDFVVVPDTIMDCVHFLMDRDCKTRTLKELQGHLWKSGYEAGTLQGHVYSDVLPMLQWMQQHNIPVFIYSSGSVKAQKLLFQYSTSGNLLPYLAGHYDIPTAGPKQQAASYTAIAAAVGLEPSEMVFCSDATAELVAAQQAGIGRAVMTIRPGNAPLATVADNSSNHTNGKRQSSSFVAIYSLLQLCGAE